VTPLVGVVVSGVALGAGVPLVLGRLARLERWPRLAACLWLTAAAGAVGTLVLAGLLLLVPSAGLAIDVAALLRTCVMALRQALDAPAGAPGAMLGLLLLAITLGGVLVGGVRAGGRVRRVGREHRALLALAGRPCPGLPGVTVLDHPVPLAWCLAGRLGPVVLTTAALARLDVGQLGAVLAHERAHQAGRHHGLVLAAEALRSGFPWLPAARTAPAVVRRLIELAADDAAARGHGRATVAAALTRLGTAATPAAALAAAGSDVDERIDRLVSRAAPAGVGAVVAGVLVVAVPLAWQLLAVAGPLVRVAGVPVCPFG
jgi:Zn-dependent protease with chaperone function